MYGTYDPSTAPKATLSLLHVASVALAATFLFYGVFHWFGGELDVATLTRRTLLVVLAATYLVRLLGTTYLMLHRSMGWSEVWTVGPWLLVIHVTMAWAGGTNAAAVGWLEWLGVALYASGTYLNSGSELGRKRFKQRPDSKGKLYTGGLFRWSMHINYFGDVVAFTGFALVTGVWWTAYVPVTMLCSFVFLNIPMLDAYLAERYGEQFTRYAARTKRLVPWVY